MAVQETHSRQTGWRFVVLPVFLTAAAIATFFLQPWVELRVYCIAVVPAITVQAAGFAFELMQKRAYRANRTFNPVSLLSRAFVFGVLYIVLIGLLVTILPLTPNIRVVDPFPGREVSHIERVAGSLNEMPLNRDLWVEVLSPGVVSKRYFFSVAFQRNERIWESRSLVNIGGKPGSGDEGALYTLVLYFGDREVSQRLKELGGYDNGVDVKKVPPGLTKITEIDFRRKKP
jgi:hypothetical protein